MFLDPHQPLTTCSQTTCEDCPLERSIHCHFQGKDLAAFFSAVFPAFLLGGIGLYRSGLEFFLPWAGFIPIFFGLIEIRVLCSHCPHYHEPGSSLKCWANYGSPKIWRFRPGPMSKTEKGTFLGGLLLITGFPLFLILWQTDWILAGLYLFAVGGAAVFMKTAMCSECMNFACPLNTVDEARKRDFFQLNPDYAAGWKAGQSPREG